MEIKGRLVKILEPLTGMGKNGEWRKQDFVIELDGTYPKKVCFTSWGDKINIADLMAKSVMVDGAMIKVHFDAESREYQGKWFTNLVAWKIDAGDDSGVSAPAPMPPMEVYQSDMDMSSFEKDDLPF
jgi:hypothetical protein